LISLNWSFVNGRGTGVSASTCDSGFGAQGRFNHSLHRGASPTRTSALLGPYRRTMPSASRWS
jgi:hypothetical protein